MLYVGTIVYLLINAFMYIIGFLIYYHLLKSSFHYKLVIIKSIPFQKEEKMEDKIYIVNLFLPSFPPFGMK